MEFDEYSKQYQGKKQFHFILLNVYRLHLQAERMLENTEFLSLAYICQEEEWRWRVRDRRRCLQIGFNNPSSMLKRMYDA